MLLKELYRNFLIHLQEIYTLGEATTITDWIFESIAGIKRADIIKEPMRPLKLSTTKPLNEALAQLLEHMPIQYVVGEAWFYHLKLKVNDQVLIPRPETEELVELAIRHCKSIITDPAILDIGTGSGCIAIAIKKNLPAARVTAIDISENALQVATENAKKYHTAVNFIKLDLLQEISWASLPVYDIIISNPPYIPLKEKNTMAKNVLDYEPPTALFVADENPLIFYDKIAVFGRSHLQPGGRIFLETNESLAKETKEIFEKDYSGVQIKKDRMGKERMVIACY